MKIRLLIALIISAVVVGWSFWLVSDKEGEDDTSPVPTAIITEGTQLIDITAKGGYSPRVVMAKAGVPTVLRVSTNGTFDCSSSIVIPKLGYQKFLGPTGTEDIAISAEQAQGTLQGTCSMGMYNFKIKFE